MNVENGAAQRLIAHEVPGHRRSPFPGTGCAQLGFSKAADRVVSVKELAGFGGRLGRKEIERTDTEPSSDSITEFGLATARFAGDEQRPPQPDCHVDRRLDRRRESIDATLVGLDVVLEEFRTAVAA